MVVTVLSTHAIDILNRQTVNRCMHFIFSQDESPVLNDTGTKHGLTGQGNKERNLQNTDFETRWTDEVPCEFSCLSYAN